MGLGAALLGQLAIDRRADQRMNEVDRMPGRQDLGVAKPIAELPGAILADPGQLRGMAQLRSAAEHRDRGRQRGRLRTEGVSRGRIERATGSVPSDASSPAASSSGPIDSRPQRAQHLGQQERVAARHLAAGSREFPEGGLPSSTSISLVDRRAAQRRRVEDLGRIEPQRIELRGLVRLAGARADDDEHGGVGNSTREEVEPAQRLGVRPLGIVDHEISGLESHRFASSQ